MTTDDIKRWHGTSHSKATLTDQELSEALEYYPEPVREFIENDEGIREVFSALYVDSVITYARLNRFVAELMQDAGIDNECTNGD